MKWVAYKELEVSKLKLPVAELKRRMKEPHVKELADSADDLGGDYMQAPTVNADTKPPTLIAGRDRMAAALLRKRKKVWCHVGVDWSGLDLVKAEIHENLRRRQDDRDAMRADLVKRTAALLPLKPSANSGGKLGRKVTALGEARRLVAEGEGVSTEAIRHSEDRAKVREERPAAETSNASDGSRTQPAPPIDLHGHEMPAHMGDVPSLVKQFEKLDKLLRQAQSAATELGMFGSVPPGIIEAFKRSLHNVAVHVRSEMPSDLCPKCDGKSVPVKGPFCPLCNERGWVRADAYNAAPKKKPSAEEFVREVEHRASEHAAGLDAEPAPDIDRHIARAAKAVAPRAAKPKRQPRVVIANTDGSETEVTDELADAWVE